MTILTENYKSQTEYEFLSIMFDKQHLLGVTLVKPEYFSFMINKKMFNYFLESYQKYKIIDFAKISEKHKDFDLSYMAEIIDGPCFENNWERRLEIIEENICNWHKERIAKSLMNDLNNEKISYEEFNEKIKKLDDVVLINKSARISIDELNKGISEEHTRIRLNKYPLLNKMLEFSQTDFMVVGAPTGTGKSGFLINLMNQLMAEYQCIYFNLEMSKKTIYKRLISINSGVPINFINTPETDCQNSVIEDAKKKIEESKIIIEHRVNNLKQIKSLLIKLKDKSKHTIIFVDHIGLLRIDNAKSLYEQTTEIAKELRQICLEFDCTVISACQLNRQSNKEEIGLHMLKDSGELENSASKVLLLYKTAKVPKEQLVVPMTVEIAKNRDGMMGTVKMDYDKGKQIFTEVTKYDN